MISTVTRPSSRAPLVVPATRRAPVQTRSRERITTILDVTAQLVDRIGPENVTTTVIAEHARMSVGSIYAYFKDRAAIFDSIVTRSIERQDAIITETRERFADLPFQEASFHVIDAIATLYRTEPGFRALWFSNFMSPEMVTEMRRSDEENARTLLERMRTTHRAHLVCPDPMVAARLYVGLIDIGLGLAFRHDAEGDQKMIDETKHAAATYLASYLRPLDDVATRRSANTSTRPARASTTPKSTGTARATSATAKATPSRPVSRSTATAGTNSPKKGR